MMDSMIPVLAGTLAAATPLIFAGLGELVAERSGVINLGVEGMILIGAIAGFAAAAETGLGPAAGLPAGALAGMGAALVFAVFALSLAANQAACGLALTIFGIGLSAFIGQHYVSYSLPGLKPLSIPLLSDIPVIGPVLFHQDAVVYLSLAAFALVAWTLAKTRLGLLLKAVGESPEAAHAIGYPVLAIRYGAVLFGGAMAGLAGVLITMNYGTFDFYAGFIIGIKAFTAAVLGGIGSLPGAMLGGLLLGVAEAQFSGMVNSDYKDVFSFGLLVVILIFRPQGLLGRPIVAKV